MKVLLMTLVILFSQQLFAQSSIDVNPALDEVTFVNIGYPNDVGEKEYIVKVNGIDMGTIYLKQDIYPNRYIQNAKSSSELLVVDFSSKKLKTKAIPVQSDSADKIALAKCLAQRDQIETIITDFMTNQNNSGRSNSQARQPIQLLEQTSDLDSLYFR